MSDGAAQRDEAQRVEELLRINAELAAEIRRLNLGRAEGPRSARVPASRRISKLFAERDQLTAERDEAIAGRDGAIVQLKAARSELAAAEEHNRQLREHLDAQTREVQRLRSGLAGVLRRLRARLLRT